MAVTRATLKGTILIGAAQGLLGGLAFWAVGLDGDLLGDGDDRVTAEIDRRLVLFEPVLAALDTILGVNRTSGISIVAETGADMHRFPTAGSGLSLNVSV